MKTLIVFYSLKGDTKFLADVIATELESDVLELKPVKEIPKNGIKKFILGGKSVLFKEKPKLCNSMPDFNEYDTIFIGTPIWAGSYTPPIATFLSKTHLHNKRIALFASHAGGGAQKCFTKLQETYGDNSLIGTIEFTDPLKDDKDKVKTTIKRWLHEIT
ncbi:MAG: flavodoxin family protein [Anaerocolumna sp.]